MKTMKLLTMAVIAMMVVSSCQTKSDGPTEPNVEKAILTVRFADSKASKADGEFDGTATSAIKNAVIVVFRSNGAVDKLSTDKPDAYKLTAVGETKIEATTQAAYVAVIVNAGTIIDGTGKFTGDFAGVATYDQFRAKTANLTSGADGAGDATQETTTNGILMSGVGAVTEKVAGNRAELEAAVQLEFVPSTIKIEWVKAMTNSNDAVTIEQIFILNASGTTSLLPLKMGGTTDAEKSLVPGLSSADRLFIGGVAMDGGWVNPNTGAKVNAGVLAKTVTDQSINNKNHFYVFENDEEKTGVAANDKTRYHRTIAVIKASYTAQGSTAKTTYYPVTFYKKDVNSLNDGQSIVRGKNYKVTMTIKGIGVDDPTNPVETANVAVNVTAATWTVVSVPKDFN